MYSLPSSFTLRNVYPLYSRLFFLLMFYNQCTAQSSQQEEERKLCISSRKFCHCLPTLVLYRTHVLFLAMKHKGRNNFAVTFKKCRVCQAVKSSLAVLQKCLLCVKNSSIRV